MKLMTPSPLNRLFSCRKYFFILVLNLTLTLSLSLITQPTLLHAQDDAAAPQDTTAAAPADAPNADPTINNDGIVQNQTFIIDDFENADLWFGGMWIDDGVIQVRKVYGAPPDVRSAVQDGSFYSLGAKIQFLRRTFSHASIEPPREIIIPGITERLSVRVQGRGAKHKLFAVIRDFDGRTYRVPFGTLNFNGWQKMEAVIPKRITQQNSALSTYYRRQGIVFVAFFIEFNMETTFGNFFVYFDQLEATSNVYLYEEQIRNELLSNEERIDPIDNW